MRDVPLVTACLQPQYRQAREHASPVLSPHPSRDQTERSPVELAFLHLGSEQPLLMARHFVFVSNAYCPEKQHRKVVSFFQRRCVLAASSHLAAMLQMAS